MSMKKTLLITASTAICTLPVYALAQGEGGFLLEEAEEKEPVKIYTSEVELGLGYVSEDSFKFGEYSGHETDGLFGVGNVEVYRRAPYDSDSSQYWSIVGTNLGLESRTIRGEYGQQGKFGLFAEFDQIPHFRFEDGRTPFIGEGGTTLTLPPGWVPATDAPGFAALEENLNDLEIETDRTRYGGGFSWNIMEGLELSAKYRREDKDGLDTIAGIFGTNGGDPRAAILPKPIDYVTDEVDVTLAYSEDRLQTQLSYHFSSFDNNQDSLTWDNPFNALGSWDPSQDFDNGGQGRLALEPDNSAHKVALSGAYILSPTMRVAGNFAYGRMLQDDKFLPFTINPDLSVPVGLPRDSLDGDVTTLHGNLTFTARPTPKSDFKLAYTFDDRDNDTPRDVYLRVANDTADQGTIDSSLARINRPYSRQSHEVDVEGGYRILSSTKLGLGYNFETVDRDFTEVDDTYEHAGRINLRSSPFSFASGWLEYEFSTRDGSDYVSNEPFLSSHTEEFLAGEAPEDLFENNPFLRKFYIADRRRHLVKGAITAMPSDEVVVGLSGSYNKSDYHNTVLGLTDMNFGSATVDVSYVPNDWLTLSGFVSYERAKYQQTGFERVGFGPFSSITPDDNLDEVQLAFNQNGFWDVETTDRGFTIGAGIEWAAIPDRLKFTADYAFSRMVTDFDLSAERFTAEPLPDLTTKLHSVGVTGEYNVRDDLALRLGYRFEYFDVDDFALDGVGLTVPTTLGLGNDSPNYSAHVVWGSVVLRF